MMRHFTPSIFTLTLLISIAQPQLLSSWNPLSWVFGSPYPAAPPRYPYIPNEPEFPSGRMTGAEDLMEPQNQEAVMQPTGWNETCYWDIVGREMKYSCCLHVQEREIRAMCWECKKAAKAAITLPYCCHDHDNAREWCRQLVAIG